MTRRELLHLLTWQLPIATLLAPKPGHALGRRSKFTLAQLQYSSKNPIPRPNALRRLAWEIEKRTSIDVNPEPVVVRIMERNLFEYPFLYLGGDQHFELFSVEEIERLRNLLIYGGFLLIDSADARPGGGFDKSVRQLVQSIFPKQSLKKIDEGHVIYKSFYLLDRPVGRVATVPYLEGIEQNGQLMLLYSQNDLAGAWSRDNFGQWEYGVYPGGDNQREQAIRWGANIIMYSLCLDYKTDQVHIPFILKRRRWQVK